MLLSANRSRDKDAYWPGRDVFTKPAFYFFKLIQFNSRQGGNFTVMKPPESKQVMRNIV